MPSVARSSIAPLYLFACLLLGGSAQGIWQNAVLQIVGLGLIAWAVVDRRQKLGRTVKMLIAIMIVAIAIVLLQQIPFPWIWHHGFRGRLLAGFNILGQQSPALPISVSPFDSFATLLCLIPPVALFSAMAGLNAYRRSWLVAALLAGVLLGTLLGALQVASPQASSIWYLYPQTNLGLGVGFFANANHMASLLVVSLPFVAALAVSGRSANIQRYSTLLVILGATVLIIIVGLALNGSLAGYSLAVPAGAGSALILLSPSNRYRRWVAGAAAIAIVLSVGALASSSVGATKIGVGASSSLTSRQAILTTTSRAVADFMPWGSGLGTFLKVYRLYESPDAVTSEYVVHAHNDYAELTLELGFAGILLMLAFLAWWAVAAWKAWRSSETSPYARAAAVASGAILLHSLVDFPLRTAAIAACFAMCMALLADRREPLRQEASDLRPTRHVVID